MSRLLRTQVEVAVDIDWYLSAYPDALNDILDGKYRDALDHYLTVGIRDGRLPTEPDVDETWYRHRYPDVDEAITKGIIQSAKQHYARWGYREGRFANGDHPAASEVSLAPAASPFPATARAR